MISLLICVTVITASALPAGIVRGSTLSSLSEVVVASTTFTSWPIGTATLLLSVPAGTVTVYVVPSTRILTVSLYDLSSFFTVMFLVIGSHDAVNVFSPVDPLAIEDDGVHLINLYPVLDGSFSVTACSMV